MSTSSAQTLSRMNGWAPRTWGSMPWLGLLRESKQLSVIAGPLILSSLVSMGVSIIDLSMMAWLGPTVLAAGAIASDYYSVFFYFFAGILAASATLIARARGEQDSTIAHAIIKAGVFFVIVFGFMGLTILWNVKLGLQFIGIETALIELGQPYAKMMGLTFISMLAVNLLHYVLSAHGKTNAIFFASLFALPINALGNYVLMFGHFGFPALGLAGAGLSSFIAASFMFLFLMLMFKKKRYLPAPTKAVKTRGLVSAGKELIRVGLPIGVSNLGEMGVFLFATVLMGRFGAEVVAAHVVALRLAGVLYAIPMGFAQAATVRIGYALGARRTRAVFRTGITALVIALCVGLLYLVLISTFRSEISMVFLSTSQATDQVIIQASLFLLILAIAQPLDCIGTIGNGILRGFKDTQAAMLFSMIAFWGVGFLGGILLAFNLGWAGTGLWIGLAASSAAFAILIGLRILWAWRNRRLIKRAYQEV